MGTALFSTYNYSRSGKQSQASALPSSTIETSGKFTTSTTPANVEDNTATDITMAVGQIIGIVVDEDAWVNFGGISSGSGIGHPLPANVFREFECDQAGTVSIRDDA